MDKKRQSVGKKFKKKWDRFLSLDEMRLDRWKKARLLGFGEKSSAYEHCFVYGKPKVGKNVWLGPFTLIDGTGGLEIGDGCDVSAGAQILTHSTHLRCVSGGKQGIIKKPVKIGRNSFIGTNAVILPGVSIGDECVVAAGAVVTEDVPSRTVVAGVPAKKIGRVATKKGKKVLVYPKPKKSTKTKKSKKQKKGK